jgi:hypothetical protein
LAENPVFKLNSLRSIWNLLCTFTGQGQAHPAQLKNRCFVGGEASPYHAAFLTHRFPPKELLTELWGLGWVKVQRIENTDFHYLLKYM